MFVDDTPAHTRFQVLLVDDHALFRAGLSLIVGGHPLVKRVLEAESVMAASQRMGEVVHVVLLDHYMPGISGLDGLKLLQQKFPDAAIAMVSASADDRDILLARQLGARGFIPKTAHAPDILQALSALLRGQDWFPDTVPPPPGPERVGLTGRQMEVLGHLCGGLSNRAIALRMDISENTVRTHVSAVLAYLNVNSRAEAIVAARQQGMVL